MSDADIRRTISDLVTEEHRLRSDQVDEDARARLAHIEESLDQCWDLLRQRQALRDSGADPEQARSRAVGEVEGYLQ
ncbi:MAG TPA: DUF2630 family protein [Actinomycetes bacterium]|nr:DUF2630 family protein [Actinomycetes bacterium]